MAQIVTISLLLDEPNPSMIHDALNDMMQQAMSQVDPDNPDEESWIVDYVIGEPIAVSESLNDSICNETYEENDMVSDPAYDKQDAPRLLQLLRDLTGEIKEWNSASHSKAYKDAQAYLNQIN